MRTGHLFAGIDGLGLGLEPHGFRTVWFSEYEDAPSQVLKHHYPDVPNHGDITAIDWSKVEPVDVLTGGFPCQDLSYAGKGAGIKEGTRSGLWFEYVRAIRALRPRLVIVENVSALTTRGLDIVLGDLHESGFDAEWSTLRASDVGAAHRRERLFIVAYADTPEPGLQGRSRRRLQSEQPRTNRGTHVADRDVTSGEARAADSLRGVAGRGPGQPVGDGRQDAADAAFDGRTEGRAGPGQRPGDTGLAASNRGATSDAHHLGQQHGRIREGASATTGGGSPDWGEFAPAIRRWEHVTGRTAPDPTVDGRLSADFVTWHMGFPEGWVDVLSRNQALKALGNAVVPQVADVIGRWAAQLTVEVAA